MILSYHNELLVKEVIVNNKKSYILGFAFQIDPNRSKPEEEVEKYNSIEECYSTWSGRWILIYENQIHLDACGTLACFYTKTEDDEVWITSSLSLLNESTKIKKDSNENVVRHKYGMDWYPGPYTVLKDVKQLLPNQVLIFDNKELLIKERKSINLTYEHLNDEKIINLLCKYMINLLKEIEDDYKGKILLPLTSGYDSRALLALCINSGIKFETYTLESPMISQSDIKIPKIMCRELSINHTFNKINKSINEDRLNEFDRHTFGMCVDVDRTYYGRNQHPQDKAIVIKGGIWAISKGAYDKILIENGTIEEKYESVVKAFDNINKSEIHKKSIKEWIELTHDIDDNMNWRDRLYMDQRIGCWLSSIEQALDITDTDRIHPVNNKIIISLLLSMSENMRKGKKTQIYIIQEMCPELLKYPLNKVSIKDYYKKIYNITKQYGIKSCIELILSKIKRR